MKSIFSIFLLVFTSLLKADTITVDTNWYSSSQLANASVYYAVGSPDFPNNGLPVNAFNYYGFPVTNDSYNQVYAYGLTSISVAPPVQVAFDFTGTNLELQGRFYNFIISDGQTTTDYTNGPAIPSESNYSYVEVGFGSNLTHHLTMSIYGSWFAINTPANAYCSPRPLPKQNLLIVEGDSYTQGYHQDTIGYHYWFDGWVWQLAHLVPNTIAVQSGIGGTGFVATNSSGQGNYLSRVKSDICTLYTNEMASGKYNQIFIGVSGTINDVFGCYPTNQLFANATNVLSIIQQACPAANVFLVHNWRMGQGETYPSSLEYDDDITLSNAASLLGIPHFSPIQANLLYGGFGTGIYPLFFPAAFNTDNIHPGRYGYGVMAQWMNGNLANAYGTNWTGGGTGSAVSTYSSNGSGNPNSTGGPGNAASSGFSVNVADYGAVGDAVQFYVNTVSNSVVVTTTNQLSNADVGKVIEVFGVGGQTQGLNENGVQTTDFQDAIGIITNVVNATNVYCNFVAQQTLTATFGTYGTDNLTNFMAAIAEASGQQSAVVNIPAGTYLLMPINRGGVLSSMYLQGGGINFVGAGQNSTVLLGRGAWYNQDLADGFGPRALRGSLVELRSDSWAPFTNNYPVSFSSLTFDGGVPNGNATGHNYPANNVTGNGWGSGHNAYQLVGATSDHRVQTEGFTNVTFIHWRAEELIATDAYTNGSVNIVNCRFEDGNATALNIYPSWNVHDNVFTNLFQIAELYQLWQTNTGWFYNNTAAGITGNGFAINGGVGYNPPFIISNNVFSFPAGGADGILTTPGDNIVIISNTIYMGSLGNAFVIGAAGYQSPNNSCNSNILISCNTVYGGGGTFVAYGSGSPNQAVNLTVCSNTFDGGYGANAFGLATNVNFYANNFGSVCRFSLNASGAPYAFINTNNVYCDKYFADGARGGGSNVVSYANGWSHPTPNLTAGTAYSLDDSSPNQMPSNLGMVAMQFENSSGWSYPVYLSSTRNLGFVTVPAYSTVNFYWNNYTRAWTANSALIKPTPPNNFRLAH